MPWRSYRHGQRSFTADKAPPLHLFYTLPFSSLIFFLSLSLLFLFLSSRVVSSLWVSSILVTYTHWADGIVDGSRCQMEYHKKNSSMNIIYVILPVRRPIVIVKVVFVGYSTILPSMAIDSSIPSSWCEIEKNLQDWHRCQNRRHLTSIPIFIHEAHLLLLFLFFLQSNVNIRVRSSLQRTYQYWNYCHH